MSTLVVVGKTLFPVDSGSKQRAVNLISAACSIGPVDVFSCAPDIGPTEESGFASLGVRAVQANVTAGRRASRSSQVDRLLRPQDLRNVDSELSPAFPSGSSLRAYSRVLTVEHAAWRSVRHAIDGVPVVVDLENVMASWSSRIVRARLRLNWPPRNRRTARGLARAGQALLDAQRWRMLEREIVRTSAAVMVCSNAEKELIGGPQTKVVPNGYDRPGKPLGRLEVGVPPVVLFPGKMTYEPNLDGAYYLLDHVLPHLRVAVPGARVIIAGRAPLSLLARSGRDVEVTGYVEKMTDVLQRADLVIVPLRAGGGTRIKILEAWAHRIPVVSTSIGAEGLEVQSGVDLMLGDTPEAIAGACAAVLSDSDLRGRLAENGERRVAEEFDWSNCQRLAAEVLERA